MTKALDPLSSNLTSDHNGAAAGTANWADASLPPDWNYEATVTEVETIINQIELGELELADVFQQFSSAVDRLRQCEAFLNRQQQQVDLLIETLLDEPEVF